jgi:hypothetical protein
MPLSQLKKERRTKMPSKKFLVFFRALLAIVTLFAATDAIAFCDYCGPTPATPPIQVAAGGWAVRLNQITPATGCGFDPCYQWTYRIFKSGTNSITGLNFAAMLIPDCCSDPTIIIKPFQPANLFLYPVAQGEPTLGFGKYIESGYVIKGTPDSSTYWVLLSSTNMIGTVPVVLKTASGIVTMEAPGPACGEPINPYSPEIKKEDFYIQDVKIKIEWNETNPCNATVYYSLDGGGTYYTAEDVTQFINIEGSPLVECGPVEGNQKCQRCRFTTKGSPQYTYIKVGDRTYKVCICDCLGTPACR